MSKLRTSFLNLLQELGDNSGCHQMPERSFCIKGYTFPVCARCTGVFIGQVSAVLVFLTGLRINWIIAVSLLLIMGLDWFIQHIGLKESNNIRRFITGIAGGFGLFTIYLYLFISVKDFIFSFF